MHNKKCLDVSCYFVWYLAFGHLHGPKVPCCCRLHTHRCRDLPHFVRILLNFALTSTGRKLHCIHCRSKKYRYIVVNVCKETPGCHTRLMALDNSTFSWFPKNQKETKQENVMFRLIFCCCCCSRESYICSEVLHHVTIWTYIWNVDLKTDRKFWSSRDIGWTVLIWWTSQ